MIEKIKIGYRFKDFLDFKIFIPTLLLTIIGLLAVYSSTHNNPDAVSNFQKQFYWVIISYFIMLIILMLPSQILKLLSIPSYLITVLFLIAVHFIGKQVYGAKSWLNLGFFGFQPSEFAKIGTIMMMAYWLTDKQRDLNNIKDISIALLIGGIPIILILAEPDFGTSIVFMVITVTMIFWSGINLFTLFVVLSPGFVAFASLFGPVFLVITLLIIIGILFYFKKNIFLSIAVLVFNISAGFFFDFAMRFLRPHQQNRITTFVNPETDPLGAGYNSMQAKVAIGSGGIFGKGYLEGNQTQLNFIPKQWTDFIFCVIGEEFGFIGSVITIALFIFMFVHILNLATHIDNKYSSLLLIGVLSMFFTHFAINLGMNLNITPVVGLPLPFISYGGSSFLANIILIAITLNIYRNRKQG